MRVLMIAPQPYFESRGAPFCVHQHIKALVALGYEVDLVTYSMGQTLKLPGLRIFRAPKVPFIRSVKPGPSAAKFPLDALIFFTALLRLCLRKYRYIHTHEEAGVMGALLAPIFGCKHLYYMHSDLSQVVASSDFTKSRLLMLCVKAVQNFMLRRADEVIVFYPEIAKAARSIAPGKAVHLILPPAVDEGLPPPKREDVEQLRRDLQLGAGPVLLYTGTLERYQGIDLLLRSIPLIRPAYPAVRFVIAGGKQEQIDALQQLARELGVADIVRFVGQRPLEEMPLYMALATILLSPRSRGTHTPLKLYTYLRAGKPILATDILAHTQILTPDVALLVPPAPEELARGALALLEDRPRAEALGACAQRAAEERYSWSSFLEANRRVYAGFMKTRRDAHALLAREVQQATGEVKTSIKDAGYVKKQ